MKKGGKLSAKKAHTRVHLYEYFYASYFRLILICDALKYSFLAVVLTRDVEAVDFYAASASASIL